MPRRGRGDLPFPLHATDDQRAQKRTDGVGDRDDERVLQAGRDGDAFRYQQRRHPRGETVITERLKEVEDRQQDRSLCLRLPPDPGERAFTFFRWRGGRVGQRTGLLGNPLFDRQSSEQPCISGTPMRRSRTWDSRDWAAAHRSRHLQRHCKVMLRHRSPRC
jgi:hypothetical protein